MLDDPLIAAPNIVGFLSCASSHYVEGRHASLLFLLSCSLRAITWQLLWMAREEATLTIDRYLCREFCRGFRGEGCLQLPCLPGLDCSRVHSVLYVVLRALRARDASLINAATQLQLPSCESILPLLPVNAATFKCWILHRPLPLPTALEHPEPKAPRLYCQCAGHLFRAWTERESFFLSLESTKAGSASSASTCIHPPTSGR